MPRSARAAVLLLSLVTAAMAAERPSRIVIESHGQDGVVDSIDGSGNGTYSGSYSHSSTDHRWFTYYATSGSTVTVTLSTPGWNSYIWLFDVTDDSAAVGDTLGGGYVSLQNGGGGQSNVLSHEVSTSGQYLVQLDSYNGGSGNYTLTIAGAGAAADRPIAFDIYNQGRGAALPSHVRAVVSDHDSLETHLLGTGRDVPVEVSIVSPPCDGENCTPQLNPGEKAQYTGNFDDGPAGGFGRHVILEPETNEADENGDGTFTLTSSDSTSSTVSFLFGRYLWIEADAARDLGGEKLDESLQELPVLQSNDAQMIPLPADSPTFGALTHLSATFTSLAGGAGNGTPRLEIHLGAYGKILVRLGSPTAYTDADATLNTWSGVNMIGNNDAGRYDLSQLGAGASSATYAEALAAATGYTVTQIDFVADSGPGTRSYTLAKIEVGAE